jgi:hypothetical protein
MGAPQFASYDEFLDHAYAAGWSDGFPVVPPEPELIDAALSTLCLDADAVVAEAAVETAAKTARPVLITARDIATHAVLAGCLPEYLPVVTAAVQAFFDGIAERQAAFLGLADTAQCVIVNGPIRRELNVNCHLGAFGPGWRANATIGRALRLIVGATFGARQARFLGDPALYTFCFGEDEERSTPWQPLHVEKGFAAQASTATVHSVHLYTKPLDRQHTTAQGRLDNMIGYLRGKVSGASWFPGTPVSLVLVLGDEYHRQFRDAGWDKRRMRDYLFPRLVAAGAPIHPVHLTRPEDILIVAAGGLALASFWSFISFGTSPATRAIDPLRRTA